MITENYTENGAFNIDTTSPSSVDPTLIFGPQRDSLLLVITMTIIYAIIFVTGLVGNIFTCIVIIRNKSMHTATNYYLFSLAVSDLLLLVSGLPQEMYSIWSKWPYVFGAAFCLIRGLAAETSTNASILTITLFTIERYLAICHPFQSHRMSKLSRAVKHVILLWIVAFAFALPQALQFGITSFKGVVMCLQMRVIIQHSFEISTFLFFLAPIVLITVLYFLIGLKLNETSNGRVHKDFEVGEMRSSSKINRRHSKSTKRVIKMLVAVVAAFFICWAPFHAQRLVAIYGTTTNHRAVSQSLHFVYSILTYTSGILYYVSTCINPILYHIMCNKFRVAFKNTVLWCCFFGRRSARKRNRGSVLAFARVPTSSGSDQSGVIGSRNEFNHSTKRKVENKETEDIEKHQRFPSRETNSSHGYTNKCHHNTISTKWEQEKLNLRSHRSHYNCQEPFWSSLHCSRMLEKNEDLQGKPTITRQDTISNSSLKESKAEDLEDELVSYLREVKERLGTHDSFKDGL